MIHIEAKEWAEFSLSLVSATITELHKVEKYLRYPDTFTEEERKTLIIDPEELRACLDKGDSLALVVSRQIPFFALEIQAMTECQYIEISLDKKKKKKTLVLKFMGNELWHEPTVPMEIVSTYAARRRVFEESLAALQKEKH